MSTQGVVAVGSRTVWRGIYNYSDSYPTELGKALRASLVEQIAEGKSLKDICDNILAFDDWRNYENGGICPYCGKIATQPHSMGADLVMGGSQDGEFPDPDCLRHSHEEMDLDALQITNEDIDEDSDHLEWIYVINVKSRIVHVLDNRKEFGGLFHAGDISLRGEVPDYQNLECGKDFSRCTCCARAHFPELEDGPQSRLSTRQYLGSETVGAINDAIAVIINGERYDWDGKAFTEDGFMFSNPKPRLDKSFPNALHAELEIDEEKLYVPVGVFERKDGQSESIKRPAPGVAWVFPATQVMPEFAVVGR